MNGPLLKNTESAGAGGRWSQPPTTLGDRQAWTG